MTIPPAHVRVPIQRPLAPSATSVTSVGYDMVDNEIPRANLQDRDSPIIKQLIYFHAHALIIIIIILTVIIFVGKLSNLFNGILVECAGIRKYIFIR